MFANEACALPHWPFSRLIAHRGGGDRAPENTLAGLAAAAAAGFRAVEFDVMLSADGVPVLMHDETLARTTDGQGRVCDTPAATLACLDAGSWFAPAFAGEPVPTLAAAIAACQRLGLWANIEIKPAAGYEQATGAVVARQVQELWQGAMPPLLSSFSPVALLAARDAAPLLPRAVLLESLEQDWQHRLRIVDAVAVHCAAEAIDATAVCAVHAAQYGLAVYTVNDLDSASRLDKLGVDAIFTDRLQWGWSFPGNLSPNLKEL
jgi:glycerophosphoryl diester phosphodiesterase